MHIGSVAVKQINGLMKRVAKQAVKSQLTPIVRIVKSRLVKSQPKRMMKKRSSLRQLKTAMYILQTSNRSLKTKMGIIFNISLS